MDINKIEYLGLNHVLKRGSGEILIEQDNALLLRNRISGAYMLACEDLELGIALLDRHMDDDCKLLMVSNRSIGEEALKKYGFSEKMECYQVAYYGDIPSDDSTLSIRIAEEADLPMLVENYNMISPEELEEVVSRKSIMLGFYQNDLVGFIGEHLEGSNRAI